MQKVMRRTSNGLPPTTMYMDDVVQGACIVSKSLKLLGEAFHEVKLNSVKIDILKCQLFRDKVTFLKYVITNEGHTADGSHIGAIDKCKPHANPKKWCSFLRFMNNYSKFVPNFSEITPLMRDFYPCHTGSLNTVRCVGH